MLRTTITKSYLQRTVRPLYPGRPKAMLLDSAWDRSVLIWPGMVAMKTTGDNVTLINGTGHPYGLFGEYIGGDGIDEPALRGVNALGVWTMGLNDEMEVLAPAFDTALTWTDPGNGTFLLAHGMTTGATRGKLVPAGTANASTRPIARVLKVSATKLTLGGLAGTV